MDGKAIVMKKENLRRLFCAEHIIIFFCFLLAVFVRFYRPSEVPYGLHIDEAGMGYDAWGLAHFRADRWLNIKPVYLVNYGGGQSALYAYLCAFCIKVFGNGDINVFLMRLPGVLVNLTAYAAGIWLVARLLGKRAAALGSFLLAILPYFIMQCRFGLDCNLLVNALTICIAFLYLAMERQKWGYFLLAGLAWGGTYYTYALSYVANTVLLLLISAYAIWTNRKLIFKILVMWVPVVLLGLPLAAMVFINQFDLEQFNGHYFTIPKLGFFRGNEIKLQNIFSNFITVIKSVLFKDWIPYNALPWYGTLYLISIPFVIIGFILLLRHAKEVLSRREWDVSVLFLAVFLVYFLMGLLLGGDGPNINKLNGLFFSVFFFLVYGVTETYHWLKGKKEKFAKCIGGTVIVLYVICFSCFVNYYFFHYSEEIYPQYLFTSTFEKIYENLQKEDVSDKTIYIDAEYIYYLLSAKITPYEYNIWVSGTEQYKNVVFHLPDAIEPDAVYIVRETNEEYIGRLQNTYQEQCSDEMFVCYY